MQWWKTIVKYHKNVGINYTMKSWHISWRLKAGGHTFVKMRLWNPKDWKTWDRDTSTKNHCSHTFPLEVNLFSYLQLILIWCAVKFMPDDLAPPSFLSLKDHLNMCWGRGTWPSHWKYWISSDSWLYSHNQTCAFSMGFLVIYLYFNWNILYPSPVALQNPLLSLDLISRWYVVV